MNLPEPNGAVPNGAAPSGVEPNGTAGSGSGPSLPARAPVPLVLSCMAGAVGLVLLVAGAVSSTTSLSVAGVVAGSASLGAALYWRSLLISSWAAQKAQKAQKQGRPPR